MTSLLNKVTFSKSERLTSKIEIEELFSKGSSFHLYPFLVRFVSKPEKQKHAVLISVSKKRFRRAVDRNRIKRLARENYRLLKPEFQNVIPHNIALVYTGKEIHDFDFMRKKLNLVFQRFIAETNQNHDKKA